MTGNDTELEAQIAEWRAYMLRRRAVSGADVDELEDHLRSPTSPRPACGPTRPSSSP
jgi:hypothetical protein